MHHFTIDEEHFKYLAVQKGNLSDHLYDRHFWQVEYDRDIENTLRNISEYFPDYLDSVLDIGSGLGGINAAIKHDVNRDIKVTLLDGFHSPAKVEKHNIPFSDYEVAKDFLNKNGVTSVNGLDIHDAKNYPNFPTGTPLSKFYNRVDPFDLIVSFQAWCFHFPPEEYIGFVKDHIIRGRTSLILDVRAEKPEWVMLLVKEFGPFEVILKKPKWSRMVFRPQ